MGSIGICLTLLSIDVSEHELLDAVFGRYERHCCCSDRPPSACAELHRLDLLQAHMPRRCEGHRSEQTSTSPETRLNALVKTMARANAVIDKKSGRCSGKYCAIASRYVRAARLSVVRPNSGSA